MRDSYIRIASLDDFETIATMAATALLEDPLLAYFGCARGDGQCKDAKSLRQYILFVLNATMLAGGQVRVACLRLKGSERIVAATAWSPPERYYNSWDPVTMLRAGILSLGAAGGLQTLQRVGWDYPAVSRQSWRQGVYCLEPELQEARNQSWGLKLAVTDSAYQNRGLMSSLMKQQFETAPGVACYVQASTVKCRKFFTNLGFELLDRRNVGSGIVNDRGEEQPLGSGFEVFSMIHWNSPQPPHA